MSGVRAPGWAISFADLCLLLLGFFIMLHAVQGRQAQLVDGLQESFGGKRDARRTIMLGADMLFVRQEAVLRPAAARRLEQIGRMAAAEGGMLRIESSGSARATSRFDGIELAAARTAAVVRAISTGGLGEGAIDVSISARSGGNDDVQRIMIQPVR